VLSTPSMLEGYTPGDLGLTEFAAYRKDEVTGREVQLEVIEFAAYCERRFAVASAPVGIGKSLIAISVAKLTGLRTAVVVPYKGLEKQYLGELAGHLVGVRGRGNYQCGDYAHLDCKGGMSMGCRYVRGSGGGASECEYERAVHAAREANVVVTNYDYWLNKHAYGQGLKRTAAEAELWGENPIELLILDEGDAAHETVSEFLACRVYENEIKRWVDPREMGDEIATWQKFVKEHEADLEAEIRTTGMELAHLGRKATRQQVEVLHGLEKLKSKFDRIKSIEDDWVLEERVGTKWGRIWAFDAIWAGRYTEQYLFMGVPKVLIMSGTLTRKDMALLGVKKDEYEYRQWASIFPAAKQPTYLCPAKKVNAEGKRVSIRIDKNTSDEDKRAWVEHMDAFIGARLDRKGLVLATSYEYAKYIRVNSRYGEFMVGNTNDVDSDDAQEEFEKFCKMTAPRIMVSPSFSRGWDFKGARAHYVIVPKCPFVPMSNKVMRARLDRDKAYGDLLCMRKVEQGNGRVKRGPQEIAECVLMDGHFEYFLGRAKGLAQAWFVESVRRVGELPKAAKINS
jgi:Rad3-related DNA helicase